MTRNEAIQRLKDMAQEISRLTTLLEHSGNGPAASDATQAFLSKCGGWEDDRSVDEIVADIRAARVDSVGRAE